MPAGPADGQVRDSVSQSARDTELESPGPGDPSHHADSLPLQCNGLNPKNAVSFLRILTLYALKSRVPVTRIDTDHWLY